MRGHGAGSGVLYPRSRPMGSRFASVVAFSASAAAVEPARRGA